MEKVQESFFRLWKSLKDKLMPMTKTSNELELENLGDNLPCLVLKCRHVVHSSCEDLSE